MDESIVIYVYVKRFQEDGQIRFYSLTCDGIVCQISTIFALTIFWFLGHAIFILSIFFCLLW